MAEANDGSDDRQSVPMSQYVGVKEMLSRRDAELADERAKNVITDGKLTEHTTKVQGLEAEVRAKTNEATKLKESTVSTEDHKVVVDKLNELNTGWLALDKQAVVDNSGGKITVEDIKDFNQEQLTLFKKGLNVSKEATTPKPDLKGGGGGDGGTSTGAQKMRAGWDDLHPEGK